MVSLRFDMIDWSDPSLLQKVSEKWCSGNYTAQAIADEIPHATRNAIMGKMHREGFERGKQPAVFAKQQVPVVNTTPTPTPTIIPKVVINRATYSEPKRCACGSAHVQPGRSKCAACITTAYLQTRM